MKRYYLIMLTLLALAGIAFAATKTIKVDKLIENSSGQGIEVDGVTLKDSGISFGNEFLSVYDEGPHTSTFGGPGWTTSSAYNLTYRKIGKMVILSIPTINITATTGSNAIGMQTVLPVELRPAQVLYLPIRSRYQGGSFNTPSLLEVGTTGSITIYLDLSTAGVWAGSSNNNGMWSIDIFYITN